jgi:hypothetical protein
VLPPLAEGAEADRLQRGTSAYSPQNASEPQHIVATHLPGVDERPRPTVERLIDLILGELPDAQHERNGSAHLHSRGRLAPADRRDLAHKKAAKVVIHKGALLADPRVMERVGRYSRAIPFRSPNRSTPTPWRRFCARLPPARRRCDPATVPGGSPVSFFASREPAVIKVGYPDDSGACRQVPPHSCTGRRAGT